VLVLTLVLGINIKPFIYLIEYLLIVIVITYTSLERSDSVECYALWYLK